MGIIYVLIPISILLGAIALAAFIYSAKSGQYDDLDTPAKKLLFPDED